jgi:hypothetical protein
MPVSRSRRPQTRRPSVSTSPVNARDPVFVPASPAAASCQPLRLRARKPSLGQTMLRKAVQLRLEDPAMPPPPNLPSLQLDVEDDRHRPVVRLTFIRAELTAWLERGPNLRRRCRGGRVGTPPTRKHAGRTRGRSAPRTSEFHIRVCPVGPTALRWVCQLSHLQYRMGGNILTRERSYYWLSR